MEVDSWENPVNGGFSIAIVDKSQWIPLDSKDFLNPQHQTDQKLRLDSNQWEIFKILKWRYVSTIF
jgi:hypothetical protein